MIDSVVPKLNDEQAKVTGEYTLSLFKEGPAHND
jgi:hypothetical protein